MATYAEQLSDVQDAISKVLNGQSVTLGDRTITRANLDTLQERERYLLAQVERDARGGVRVRGIVPLDE